MQAGGDLAITNAVHFEASYYEDHDLDAADGFVGLWGSLPIGQRRDGDEEKGAVRGWWSAVVPLMVSPKRLRTRKEHNHDRESGDDYEVIVRQPVLEREEEGRRGLFSRVLRRDGSSSESSSKPSESAPADSSMGPVRKVARIFGRGGSRR